MLGALPERKTIVYPRSETALVRGAGVENETDLPAEAYAPLPHRVPGRPEREHALPWAPPVQTAWRRRRHTLAELSESPLEQTEHGLVPTDKGWFVLNARDAPWWRRDGRGLLCEFEDPRGDRSDFSQLGINVTVLEPGEPMAMYHWEADQEDFLVVLGEALLLVEGEERVLRRWDLVHCPPGTEHVIVGAGAGPCVLIAVGARDRSTGRDWGGYTVAEAALRHGAGVERATAVPAEAYARFAEGVLARYPDGLLPD
jgi:uncharacterized cupin superfamily protein